MSNADFRRKAPPQEGLREIEVLIYSAQDLKNVKHITKMRIFAEIYVERDVHVARTRVDEHGGANPTWNEVVKVKFHKWLPEKDIMAALNVDIYADSHVGLDKHVGSARVLLCDVLKGGDAEKPLDNPIQCLTVQVWRNSGRPQGWLYLWVPPTGRFLVRRESLSFSVREREKLEEDAVAAAKEEEGGGKAEEV
ncbi:hypothetical protein CDL12_03828 [Handroanthus impetiginosus]|uniref:C2 domain-containing protein n=1 Tax=Handroanthus impetiginosus TaxID=429701 RepID=A0A2G9I113_9LAMI|nr:hypothetical protein CDL12_03828 [Handroanthus impetiginosus]